jgi:hypothetical protein
VACLAFAAPAFAQAQTEPAPQTQTPAAQRPVRGLFGGIERDPTRYRSLDLSVAFLGGYDDNASPQGTGGDPRFGDSGGIGNASANLTYRRGRNDTFFTAGARAGYRYYSSLEGLNAADYGADLAFNSRPSRRTQLSARQDLGYQPFFSFLTVPVFLPTPAGPEVRPIVDYSVADRASLTYNTSLEGGYDITRRTHVALSHLFRGLDFIETGDDGRLRDHLTSVGIGRDVTRRWRVGGRLVFGRGDNRYVGEGFRTSTEGADFTIDYRRLFRSRRQVTVSFAPGFSRLETENLTIGRRVDRRVTATLRAGIDLSPTWSASADYRRGLRQIPGVPQPAFADDVQMRVTGLIGRRVDISLTAQYTEGDPGFARSGFATVSGQAQVRMALSRLAAMTAQWVYYRYEFARAAELPVGMGREYDRNAVRVGVNLWLPLHR